MSRIHTFLFLAPLWLGVAIGGCSTGRVEPAIEAAAMRGDYGQAREAIEINLSHNPADKSYLLDRLRLLILTLADGQPDAAELAANELYALLRTQGINADRTVSSVVINERVKIWKGEPFEQALAYAYIGIQKAMRGEWDNARAAAQSSLFLLRDFGVNERGEKLTSEDLARKAATAEQQGKSDESVIDRGYTPIKTDFTLGYLLNAISNLAIGRLDEASDNLNEVEALDPALAPLCAALRSGQYNTVLVVDYGLGPRKTAYGLDEALVRFSPRTPSDNRGLTARVRGPAGSEDASWRDLPAATDINPMASSLMWNSLEGVRQAKSVIGNAMVVGGLIVATADGGHDESDQARTNRAIAGAAIALGGLLLKGSARADLRHCEFFPQRTYIAPLWVSEPCSTIEAEVPSDASSRTVLVNVDPPAAGSVQLRYIKIDQFGESWRAAGAVVYANDRYSGRVAGDDLPYIFGGNCVRSPSALTMQHYHEGGNLLGLTSTDLENLYRAEGISLTLEDQQGRSRRHILEGGDSLVCPLSGSVGYQRLFGQLHQPYSPRSDALRAAIERHRRSKNESSEPTYPGAQP